MRTMLFATVLGLLATTAESRTWRVNTAGTGDAPTLHAAMDSAVAGDVVVAAAGQYAIETSLFVPSGVELVGESGPTYTVLYDISGPFPGPTTVSLGAGAGMSGVRVKGRAHSVLYSHGAVVDYCIVERDDDGIVAEGGEGATDFNNCLFVGGEFFIVAALFNKCIILSDLGAGAIGSTLFSCDVLGYVDPAIDASATNLNFSLDPHFCGIPGSGNYFLQSTSPCLGANNPFGPFPFDIGPLGVGCGTVRVEQRTWGGIKALYRNR